MLLDGAAVSEIDAGLCVLIGFGADDAGSGVPRFARKVASLRVFEDASGRMASSVLDTGGKALVVSQFTLIADYKRQEGTARPAFVPGWKGNRPSFTEAARPEQAEPLYERFVEELRALGVPTQTGVFGAQMVVEIVNDGPVTMILDA